MPRVRKGAAKAQARKRILRAARGYYGVKHKHKYQAENTLIRAGCGANPTLQRQVQVWRAAQGPEKDVVLAQRHRPGEAAQTDFTRTSELGVTILGVVFVHLLGVFVLPYSNWLWATVCRSESIAAIRKSVQRALFQLGRVPQYHQTDHSTAATHRIPDGQVTRDAHGRRPFNEEYLAVMRHFGMTPRTTEVGAKEQNGDVEAGNGALKRRLEQALLVRGSRDFASVEAWQTFVDAVAQKANAGRGPRVAQERAAMRTLEVAKLCEYVEVHAQVSEWSTIRVKDCSYSVPSRLIGEVLTVRVYEERIEAFYRGVVQMCGERLVGRNQHRIDYRHVIWSLVRKPGGFARYCYRDAMFPAPLFRRAYDAIQAIVSGFIGTSCATPGVGAGALSPRAASLPRSRRPRRARGCRSGRTRRGAGCALPPRGGRGPACGRLASRATSAGLAPRASAAPSVVLRTPSWRRPRRRGAVRPQAASRPRACAADAGRRRAARRSAR